MEPEEGLEQGPYDNHVKIQKKLVRDTVDIFFNVGQKTGEKKYPGPSLHARRPVFFLLFPGKTNVFQELWTERRNFP